jgi:hypothetical protein
VSKIPFVSGSAKKSDSSISTAERGWMNGMSAANCRGVYFTQSDPTYLSCLHVLRECLHHILNQDIWVKSRRLENVDEDLAVEDLETFVNAVSDTSWCTI